MNIKLLFLILLIIFGIFGIFAFYKPNEQLDVDIIAKYFIHGFNDKPSNVNQKKTLEKGL